MTLDNIMTKPFIPKKYFLLALDPIHVGTGGYRLGRVDNTIVREPGTQIPKIPGSSIAGVCRSLTAILPIPIMAGKYPQCAGKSREQENDQHCGQPNCPVCVGFGFSNGRTNQSFQGLIQFSDARILFFPVHSMLGPAWITSESILRDILRDHGKEKEITLSDPGKFKSLGSLVPKDGKLNFGWLMLDSEGSDSLGDLFIKRSGIPTDILSRLFLVSDKLFSRLVNDNLEVRTSVAINPHTGTAEDKALFTYEAIPRTTVLWFDIVYNRPEYFKIDGKEIRLLDPLKRDKYIPDPFGRAFDPSEPLDQIGYLAHCVEKGMSYIEVLGLGGMNTRGFGRARAIHGRAAL